MDVMKSAETAADNLTSLKEDFNAIIEKSSRKRGRFSAIVMRGFLESPYNVHTAAWFRDRAADLQTAQDLITEGKFGEAAEQVKTLHMNLDMSSNSITLYNSVLAALVDLHRPLKEKDADFAERLKETADLLSAAAAAPPPSHIRVNRPLKLKQPNP